MRTTWPPERVRQLRESFNELRQLVRDDSKTLDAEIRGWLARLLIVRSAGFIEQTTIECARAHITRRSGGTVRSFAASYLERSKNPSFDNLASLIGRFDGCFEEDFGHFMETRGRTRKEDLAFLVDRRNRIAHGERESVGPKRALELADLAEEITDWFIKCLNPEKDKRDFQ